MDRPKLPDDSRLREIQLRVTDLERSLGFYQEVLGLAAERYGADRASLSTPDGLPLVKLHAGPGTVRRRRGTTGLYHFAVLYQGRDRLGAAAGKLLDIGYPLQGAADHLVSEAVYLADPDGTGIELYADRPRESWHDPQGVLRMATLPLDLKVLLQAGEGVAREQAAAGARLGHVHLNVASIGDSIDFYTVELGMNLIMRYGRQAAFFSVNGYHHHIGVNTWEGEGAGQAGPQATGMSYFTIELEGPHQFDAAMDRMEARGRLLARNRQAGLVQDPSGNYFQLRLPIAVPGQSELGDDLFEAASAAAQ
jgi:catechol 2,3-dioxygenase